MPQDSPVLERVCVEGVCAHTDSALRERSGIVVAFTERTGGVSAGDYASLNLAAHVGDDPRAVDVNRDRLFASLGISSLRQQLITAEQVHGETVARVGAADAGAGASASGGPTPLAATDAFFTLETGLPLLMLYADCVPVVLVAERPTRGVAVVHAGWRGALASLPGKAARESARACGCEPSELLAYVGPHIRACCYEVEETLLSLFVDKFDTIAAVDGHLDLGAVVVQSLTAAGIRSESVARVNECTMDTTDRYFSYRASGVTGRHGALAVITKVG